jgi:hypothetical protein
MVQEFRLIRVLGTVRLEIVYTAENKYFSEIIASKEFLPTDLACRRQGETRAPPLSSETEIAYLPARQEFFEETKTPRALDRVNPDDENSTILPPAHQAELCTNDFVEKPNAIPYTPNQQPILPDNVIGSAATKGRRSWLSGIAFSVVLFSKVRHFSLKTRCFITLLHFG